MKTNSVLRKINDVEHVPRTTIKLQWNRSFGTSNQGTEILVPEKCHHIIFVSVTYIERTPPSGERGHYFWVSNPFRGHLLALKK